MAYHGSQVIRWIGGGGDREDAAVGGEREKTTGGAATVSAVAHLANPGQPQWFP